MFSGIVEAVSRLLLITLLSDSKVLVIERPVFFTDLTIGDSIAVNGVCLTVTQFDAHSFSVTAVPETLGRTNLNALIVGDVVNLERAMRMDGRLGGHFVQGHVDALGTVLDCQPVDNVARLLTVAYPASLSRYIVSKGFIALDGMSVTIIDVTDTWFTVTLIPHTLEATISHQYEITTRINLEVDMIAKYIEKMLGVYSHARSH